LVGEQRGAAGGGAAWGGGVKTTNEYAKKFPDFDRTPKAVIAALCWSLAERLHGNYDDGTNGEEIIRDEWIALHANGIVPQRPIAKAEGRGA
jgi:hypothetical protein